MQVNDNILELLRKTGAEAVRGARRGMILQPGAIGDCVLTLPLAEFMKDSLGLGGIELVGNTEYIGILPGRTCVDGIRSMDSIDLHRLFVETKKFDLVDRDALIDFFADYSWIITFLGEPNSDFEQNLIFTANCSRSTEVITLPMKPSQKFSGHISDFYTKQFINQCSLPLKVRQFQQSEVLIKATESDINTARELLEEIGLCSSENLVILQPGSGGLHKCWHLDNFLAIAEQLGSKGFEVIFLLGPAELDRFSRARIEDISSVTTKCLTDLSLTQVLGLLSCVDVFVGNDSGITHLAAGLGVRTVAVFGPTDAALYRPIGPAVTVLASSPKSRCAAFAEEPSPALQQQLMEVFAGISLI